MIISPFSETPQEFYKRIHERKKLKELAAKNKKQLIAFAKARKKRKNKK